MKTTDTPTKKKRRGGRPRSPYSKQFENLEIPANILAQVEEVEKKWEDRKEEDGTPPPAEEPKETIIPWCSIPGGPPSNHPEAERAVKMTSYPTYNEFEVLDYFIKDNSN